MAEKKKRRRLIPAWAELTLLAAAALIFIALGSAVIWATLTPIPAINDFENRQVSQSTQIFDRTGNIVLYDVHGAEQRTSVPLDQISPYIQEATIATEDDTFYSNPGINLPSLLRAAVADIISHGYAQGGSTITQQVVKNSLLTQDKTIPRKIEEVILALRLTKAYSKDEILNTYLNETSYGGTIYGVEAASEYYFGVSAKDVDLAQAAYLAALPQAPTYYSPYGNNRGALDARKNYILQRMLDLGFITQSEHDQAAAEQVQFKVEADGGIKAPHFVFYIREYLEQKYGVDAVDNGGLKVITTLDYDLQQKAEQVVSKWAPEMQQNFNASNEGVVVIDPKTGQILAMVGSRDYFDNSIDGQVNVTLANRQPGSSFKPFVYATAFEKGYTPDTVVFDLPTQFSTSCSPQDTTNSTPPCYAPVNYDGKFHGPISLRDAIAISDNVASVKVLYLAGIADSLKTAQDLGITTLGDVAQYGLTLVLGGGEVNLLQMTGAYAVFANDGIKNPPTGILEVTDSSGNVLEQYQPQPQQVLDPQIAREINSILSDNTARTPEFGADSPLYFPGYDVADKTGTTNDFRDMWVLGYTPSIAVGAWAGNNDNTPMEKKIAAFTVAPMWHEIMAYALQKYSSPSDTFPPPAPNPNIATLPPVITGNWDTNPALGVHDILYWIDKDNPTVPLSTPGSSGDVQEPYWDYAVQLWAAQNAGTVAAQGTGTIMPPSTDSTDLSITSPQAGTTVSSMTPITFSATVPSAYPVASVTYYLNNVPVGTSNVPPFTVSYLPTSHGPATLHAVATKIGGGTLDQTISFTIQ